MARNLACPHCKARMAVAHDDCRRCGKPIGNAHVDLDADPATKGGPAASATVRSSARSRAFVDACVVLIAAGAVAWGLTPAANSASTGTAAPAAAAAGDASGRANDAVTPVAQPAAESTAVETAAPHSSPGDGFSGYLAGDKVGALARYLAVVERRPGEASALNNAGQLLVELGRAGEAIPYLQRAVDAEPSSAMFRFNLAAAFGKTEQWDRAVENCLAATGLDPRDGRLAHHLGMALHRAGRDVEATDAFRKATNLDPNGAQGWMDLAQTLDRLGRTSEAADAYERVAAVQPSSPEIAAIRQRIERLRARGTVGPAVPPPDAR